MPSEHATVTDMPSQNANAAEEYLGSAEAMDRLQISRRTLERWVADGRLPAVKVGGFGARRYKLADVEALLRGETPTTAEDAAAS